MLAKLVEISTLPKLEKFMIQVLEQSMITLYK